MSVLPAAVRVLLASDSLVLLPGESVDAGRLGAMVPGQQVALADSRLGSRSRLRRRARRLGLRVDSEYAVLPTWERATFVVEDHGASLAWTLSTMGTVPPGVSRGALLIDLFLRSSRATGLARLSGRLAPGRLVIASRR